MFISQVHELHPSHAFLNVPDRLSPSHNDLDLHLIRPPDPQGEEREFLGLYKSGFHQCLHQ